ncbi:MAG: acyl-CoA thioesterase [Hahellaceae bacterium]|nr:acyl-CoA thioesterase [Hahellaceae bacterium]MCP5170548.1 acyl-CoA thioesterase [Hahellaceae bacterium]
MKFTETHPAPNGELALQIIAMPKDTNAEGDIYAGWLVSQMDIAAATTAARISKGRTATVAIQGMEFLSPVRVGSQVKCYSRLLDIGRSSMKIQMEVWTQDPLENQPRKVTEATFVFVAIDENGCIRKVPARD